MSDLPLIITNAGRAALVNAANTGTAPVVIAQAGISATAITPDPALTALAGEIKRISTLSGDVVADDIIHLIVRDESADSYSLRSIGLYLGDGTLFAVYGQPSPIMEKSASAMLLLAIDVQFADVDASSLIFGDTNFLNPTATTERQGIVELATEAETTTGTDTSRAVTPKAAKAATAAALDARLGANAPSAFIKGLLTLATVELLRSALEIKSAALKDEGAGNGLNADLLDGQHGAYYADIPSRLGFAPLPASSYTAADVLAKLMTLDGAGSGIDADLLDGAHGTAYIGPNSVGTYAAYSLKTARAGYYGMLLGPATAYPTMMFDVANGRGGFYLESSGTWMLYWDGADWQIGNSTGRKVWHAANDGSGSGLDADMLDGQHASAFSTLGVGQNWQGLLGSRSANVSYQNTTGRPIQVSVELDSGTANQFQVSTDNATWVTIMYSGGTTGRCCDAIIPAGHYYRAIGNNNIKSWSELR